jgi:hypothetical protein
MSQGASSIVIGAFPGTAERSGERSP